MQAESRRGPRIDPKSVKEPIADRIQPNIPRRRTFAEFSTIAVVDRHAVRTSVCQGIRNTRATRDPEVT